MAPLQGLGADCDLNLFTGTNSSCTVTMTGEFRRATCRLALRKGVAPTAIFIRRGEPVDHENSYENSGYRAIRRGDPLAEGKPAGCSPEVIGHRDGVRAGTGPAPTDGRACLVTVRVGAKTL